jgi:hypothetical protein
VKVRRVVRVLPVPAPLLAASSRSCRFLCPVLRLRPSPPAPCSMPFFAAITAANRAKARFNGLSGLIAGAGTGERTSWLCVPVGFPDLEGMLALETSPRNATPLRLTYGAGLRVSEVCALAWRDLAARDDAGQGRQNPRGAAAGQRVAHPHPAARRGRSRSSGVPLRQRRPSGSVRRASRGQARRRPRRPPSRLSSTGLARLSRCGGEANQGARSPAFSPRLGQMCARGVK